MSVEASQNWRYASQRAQYKAAVIAVRRLDDEISEIRLEGKTGEHFSILMGNTNVHLLAQQLLTLIGLKEEDL